MKLAIGSDHVGYQLKCHMIGYLQNKGFEVTDFGTYSDERCDYPVFGQRVANAVKNGEADLGVLICGTGVGISLAANKTEGIRAVVCSEPYSAMMARAHNDANIVAFGSRVVGTAVAEQIVDAFLDSSFEGGRHKARVDMLSEIEKGVMLS